MDFINRNSNLEFEANTLCNLRLIATLQKRQYLCTNSKYNIVGIYQDSFYNSIVSSMNMETWRYTKKALHKIYVIEMPQIVKKVSEDGDAREYEKLCDLLKKSLDGLKNLKYSYESQFSMFGNSKQEYDCYLSTIIEDYCELQIWKLGDILGKYESNIEVPLLHDEQKKF